MIIYKKNIKLFYRTFERMERKETTSLRLELFLTLFCFIKILLSNLRICLILYQPTTATSKKKRENVSSYLRKNFWT